MHRAIWYNNPQNKVAALDHLMPTNARFDLQRLTRGEKEAWDNFVDQFSSVIYSAVRRTFLTYLPAANQADIDDVTQQVFLRLIKHDFHLLKSYNPSKASMATWLTIVSRSTTVDSLRRKRLYTVPLEENRDESCVPFKYPETPLKTPAGLLSSRQKLVLNLFFEREMDIDEIAALLNVKAQTIRSVKHKAIKKLRNYFRGRPYNNIRGDVSG